MSGVLHVCHFSVLIDQLGNERKHCSGNGTFRASAAQPICTGPVPTQSSIYMHASWGLQLRCKNSPRGAREPFLLWLATCWNFPPMLLHQEITDHVQISYFKGFIINRSIISRGFFYANCHAALVKHILQCNSPGNIERWVLATTF